MPRIVVDFSAHGYGHLSQILPVLTALARQRADLELVLRSAFARDVIEKRLSLPFDYLREPVDIGLVMRDVIAGGQREIDERAVGVGDECEGAVEHVHEFILPIVYV